MLERLDGLEAKANDVGKAGFRKREVKEHEKEAAAKAKAEAKAAAKAAKAPKSAPTSAPEATPPIAESPTTSPGEIPTLDMGSMDEGGGDIPELSTPDTTPQGAQQAGAGITPPSAEERADPERLRRWVEHHFGREGQDWGTTMAPVSPETRAAQDAEHAMERIRGLRAASVASRQAGGLEEDAAARESQTPEAQYRREAAAHRDWMQAVQDAVAAKQPIPDKAQYMKNWTPKQSPRAKQFAHVKKFMDDFRSTGAELSGHLQRLMADLGEQVNRATGGKRRGR